jgi:K+-sensing histidine kinase KdpD
VKPFIIIFFNKQSQPTNLNLPMSSSSPETLDDALKDTVDAVGSFLFMTYLIMIVTVAVILFLFWKFTCWVASRTNVDNCFTLFLLAMITDGVILKGNTGLLMIVLALLRFDLGNLLSSPILSKEDFMMLKKGQLTQPTSAE